MPSNPLTQAEVNEYAISRILTPPGELNPYMPQGYFLATPPVGDGPALWRLFDPEYIQGIIPADKLGTGSLGLGSLYLADDGTWKGIGGSLPPGGTAGQLLAKINDTDYNVEWIDNYALWTSQVKHEVKAGEVLLKGQAVYVSSADGTNMIVSKASNAAEVTSSKTMGLIAQNLALNGKGFVITEGLLSGLNTSAATVGDPVWLGTNGNLLYGIANKPVAPAHMVFLGIVTRVQSSNGEIFVKVQNGFELDELHDVLITSKTDKDILSYEASSGLWKNKSFLALFGGTPLVSIPTLAQVTTAGNITTNSIEVGGLSLTGSRVILSSLSSSGRLELYNNIGTRDVDFLAGGFKSILYGNLAIGTNIDAGYKLDVNGNIRSARLYSNVIRDTNQNDTMVTTVTNISNTSTVVGNAGTTNTLTLSTKASTGLVVIPNSSVGIGTSNPQYKLDVYGNYHQYQVQGLLARYDISTANANQNRGIWDFYTNAAVTPDFFGRFGFKFEGGITDDFKQFQVHIADAVTPKIVVDGSGRVGIGTITPTRTLTVNGAILVPNNTAYYTKNTGGSELAVFLADASNNIQYGSIFFGGSSIFYTSTLYDWYQYPASVLTHRMRLSSGGNLLIGTTTDAGYKLDVNGTTRLNGLTSINSISVANTALAITANGTGAGNFIAQGYDFSGNSRFYLTATGNFRINGQTDVGTTGSDEKFKLDLSFAPTSGTRLHFGVWLAQTINQTGGANGITRGLYINPTLTSAADFRAIETTAGKVIFNGGNVGVGTSNPLYKLHAEGDVNTTGVFRIGGVAGWSGIITIMTNPPGQQNISVQGGIIVNVF